MHGGGVHHPRALTAQRLRKAQLKPGTVVVKIRESDFTTVTRQAAMRPPSNATEDLYRAGRSLLATWQTDHPGAKVRLLGIGGADLRQDAQQDLFESPEERNEVDDALDQIREKFGDLAVGRARTLESRIWASCWTKRPAPVSLTD